MKILVPVVILAAACAPVVSVGGPDLPGREYDAGMTEAAAAVRLAVTEVGLVIENDGAVTDDHWSLNARSKGMPVGEMPVRVTVTVQRDQNKVRVSVSQTDPVTRDRDRKTHVESYAPQIISRLDRQLKRSGTGGGSKSRP
jgi:hypothetical protein